MTDVPQSLREPSRDPYRWILFLLVPLVIWILWPYPEVLKKSPAEGYLLNFSWVTLLKFFSCFYGLYVLPGLALFYWVKRSAPYNPVVSPQRFLLSLLWGMVAHLLAIFFQKYLNLSYQPWTILPCLIVSYAVLAILSRPLKGLLEEEKPDRQYDLLTWGMLLLALFLGMEMTLRGRASSVSLMGDGFPHLINYLGTLVDGPLPDGLPFYSTFVLNIHPMAFHALMANLKTLMPGIEHIDWLRYFSVVMIPAVIFSFFTLFTFLSRSRPVAALSTLVLIFVSGGGFSLRVPVVFFPWYWALAWCLTAGIAFIILKNNFRSKWVSFWIGILFGIGVLIHPFMAFRVGGILTLFFPIELIRRAILKEEILPVFTHGLCLAFGAVIPVAAWLLPLIIKYGWEETYSLDHIFKNFSERMPKGVSYLRRIQSANYSWADLLTWSRDNAGWFALLLAPVGIVAAFLRPRTATPSLLVAWALAMAMATVLGLLMNPYRYFEYFFLALVALAVFGMGWLVFISPKTWRALLILLFAIFSLWSIRLDFFPKYRLALKYYGRTDWPSNVLDQSGRMAKNYLKSKKQGNLDQDFGFYRGYLWSRQKKVWDIYLRNSRSQ